MKVQLLEIYQKHHQHFKDIRNQFMDDDLAGPFLMSPNTIYTNQNNPLLIVGQETKGWYYDIENLKKQMKHYENFNVGQNYFSSPFWNITRKVEKALDNEPYSCSWTNISKYDYNEGPSKGIYEKAISTLDNILIEEINIVKPKVCIFFTGPSFDWRIKKMFNGVNFLKVENYGIREFSRISHPELPELTFRSYHPNYLRRSGKEQSFIKFISSLINK